MANEIRQAFENAYVNGVAPEKDDLRDLGRTIQDIVDDLDDRVDDIEGSTENAIQVIKATWAALAGLTGTTNGQYGEVTGTDAGTHTDPVVGGTVANVGIYSWSSSPAGWQRVADRNTAASVASDLADLADVVDPLLPLADLPGDDYRENMFPAIGGDGSAWGYAYNNSTGVAAVSAVSGISGKIPIDPDKDMYTLSMLSAATGWAFGSRIHCYDASDVKLATLDPAASQIVYKTSSRVATFKPANGTAYVTINIAHATGDADQFEDVLPLITMTASASSVELQPFSGPWLVERPKLEGIRAALKSTVRSTNLYDPDAPDAGWCVSYTSGVPSVNASENNFVASGLIPCTEGLDYVISVQAVGSPTYIGGEVFFYDRDRAYLSKITTSDDLEYLDADFVSHHFVAIADACYFSFNRRYLGGTPTEAYARATQRLVQVNQSDTLLPFEPYIAPESYHTGRKERRLRWQRSHRYGAFLYISKPFSRTRDLCERWVIGADPSYATGASTSGCISPGSEVLVPRGTPADQLEDVFNAFILIAGEYLRPGGDDGPAQFINSNNLGSGHGVPGTRVTATAHGKTAADVGSKWTDGLPSTWVLWRIVDTDHLDFVRLFAGTSTSWTLSSSLPTGGTLTHSTGATHTGDVTIGVAAAQQQYPSAQNYSYAIKLDDGELSADEDGYGEADVITLSETYSIPNWKSIEAALVAAVGTGSPPSFVDPSIQAQIEQELTYTIRPGELTTVNWNLLNVQAYANQQILGLQSGPLQKSGSDKLKLFVPGVTTEGTTSLNFRNIADISSNSADFYLAGAELLDTNNKPATFVELITSSGDVKKWGQVLHYSPLVGIGIPASRPATVLEVSPIEKMYAVADITNPAVANTMFEAFGVRGCFDAQFDDLTLSVIYTLGNYRYWLAAAHSSITRGWRKPGGYLNDRLVGKPISLVTAVTDGSITLHSAVISEAGVRITVGSYAFWLAQIG